MPALPVHSFVIDGHSIKARELQPGLHIVATPIGNLSDISLRALHTLAAARLIVCEDTRITSRLMSHYGLRAPLLAYNDHNAARQRGTIMAKLEAGQTVALVSDAGTPLVSDPGYKLVRSVLGAGLAVHAVPGASAVLHALVLSGLPCDQFLFCGFLPSKQTGRRRALHRLADIQATAVIFESPARIAGLLADVVEVLGDRRVALGRELTKFHEETLRGDASRVLEAVNARTARARIKGEITLAIAPADRPACVDQAVVDAALAEAMEALPASKAAAAVARRFNLDRHALYTRTLKLKSG